METFLTLVIALGGIATGIGAIWAAMAARRQAQLSERSLAEQNERSRLTLEYDLLTRMIDRFNSPHFVSRRRAAANYLLDNAFVEDEVVEVPYVNDSAVGVCNFYEEVGEMLRFGIFSSESVWNRFSVRANAYWLLCKPALEKMREEREDPAIYIEFEYLCRVMAEVDRERGTAAPTQEVLRQVMETESVRGEEPAATTE
jgi:hypothetical protein